MKNMNDLFTFTTENVITNCRILFNNDVYEKGSVIPNNYAEFLMKEREISVWLYVEPLGRG